MELLSLFRTLMFYGMGATTLPEAARAIQIAFWSESRLKSLATCQLPIDSTAASILVATLNAAWTNIVQNRQHSDEVLISLSPIPLIEAAFACNQSMSNRISPLFHFKKQTREIGELPLNGLGKDGTYTKDRPKFELQ